MSLEMKYITLYTLCQSQPCLYILDHSTSLASATLWLSNTCSVNLKYANLYNSSSNYCQFQCLSSHYVDEH